MSMSKTMLIALAGLVASCAAFNKQYGGSLTMSVAVEAESTRNQIPVYIIELSDWDLNGGEHLLQSTKLLRAKAKRFGYAPLHVSAADYRYVVVVGCPDGTFRTMEVQPTMNNKNAYQQDCRT
jgi:hypothetical protein